MTAADRLHGADAEIGDLAARATAWIGDRLAHSPVGRVGDPRALAEALADGITDGGLGLDEAWRRFTDVAAPATIGLDSERFLAFIPMSPSAAAVWMDAVVSAASFSAESWLEAAGAVYLVGDWTRRDDAIAAELADQYQDAVVGADRGGCPGVA